MYLKTLHQEQIDYCKTIEILINEKRNIPFNNGSIENTIAFKLAVLKSFKNNINIYARSLDQVLFNYREYLEGFENTLNQIRFIRILLDNDLSNISNQTKELLLYLKEGSQKFNKKFILKIASDEFKQDLATKLKVESIYFFTADKAIVRMEKVESPNESPYSHCYDIECTAVLDGVFDKHFDQCRPIII